MLPWRFGCEWEASATTTACAAMRNSGTLSQALVCTNPRGTWTRLRAALHRICVDWGANFALNSTHASAPGGPGERGVGEKEGGGNRTPHTQPRQYGGHINPRPPLSSVFLGCPIIQMAFKPTCIGLGVYIGRGGIALSPGQSK